MKRLAYNLQARRFYEFSLHHHGEDGDVGVPILVPVPVVAVETTLVPVQLEPAAISVAEMSSIFRNTTHRILFGLNIIPRL